ncbi:hypothetical protein LPJ63_001936 [Coemansia sp. RSA 2711]|nr:hypothetical protein LPJ63_001936 [Coemansia sp. RSA 2711]KAJ1846643.1 hypothetical protein LPJ70_001937 [Coemansia sp. RSA 2708]KAJ2321714.1 hypothetical protein IWW52_000563 [Coemansia sp. RSA 2704]KAJ2369157.1 hypothetical protein H4S01_001164 [Coemansia sp. RSA 2610]KAJ2392798.1 hypothetical protein H4S02_000593 [Coemansia sp. RSA 2611]
MSASPQSSDSSKKQRTGRDDEEVLHRDPGYFQYYSQLQHQQNMLQDYVRTAAYHTAIVQNSSAVFRGATVMDVGAGSGILSFFAVQAGAKHVYAVEASAMAGKLRKMAERAYAGRITVVGHKVEDPAVARAVPAQQVDAIVSEPIGVLLVHERMLESFVYARDRFLRAGGAMLPSAGTIHLAPLSDAALWNETLGKARFWQQGAFYGVDLNPYFASAFDEYFSAPVVGCFSPNSLMADSAQHEVDFHTVSMDELRTFTVPVAWTVRYTGVMHGVAGWFDLAFVPPALHDGAQPAASYMSTGPQAPATHWQQVRLLLRQPLAVNAGQVVRGVVHMRANDQRSYDVEARLICLDAHESAACPDAAALQALMASGAQTAARVREATWLLQEQVYNYAYAGEPIEPPRPETANLYLPVDRLLAESASVVPVDPTMPTDFVVTQSDPNAMQH